jgi:hypothetical protein
MLFKLSVRLYGDKGLLEIRDFGFMRLRNIVTAICRYGNRSLKEDIEIRGCMVDYATFDIRDKKDNQLSNRNLQRIWRLALHAGKGKESVRQLPEDLSVGAGNKGTKGKAVHS